MLFVIDARLATTEHCELDRQCNDAGWKERVNRKKTQTQTETVENCHRLVVTVLELLLSLLLLQPRKAVKAVSRAAKEGALEHWHWHWHHRWQQQQRRQERSMGGNWKQTSKHCLTITSHLNPTASCTFTILSFIFTFTLTLTLNLTPLFTLSPAAFTVAFAFTFAQPPVCSVGRMNTEVDFTVCITFACPYRLMSLHQTISTSIRAVDDNQTSCS